MRKFTILSILLSFSLLVGSSFTSKAQKQPNTQEISYDTTSNLRVEFKIYINDKPVELDNYTFLMTNKATNVTTKVSTTNAFTVFLNFDQQYLFKVGHKDYSMSIIELDTSAPKINWVLKWRINILPDNPERYEGKMAYNDVTKMFQHYKQ